MVGRLVEQQHVGRLEQQLGKFDTHTPSSGEFARRAVEVRALKTKSEQRLLHVLFEVRHVYGVEFLRERRHFFYELHIFVALVVGACGKFVVDAVYFCLYLVQMGESLAGLVEHCATVFCHQVLRQIGDDAILRCRNAASCGSPDTSDNLEQRALACSIFSHQGYTVLLVYLEGDVFE